MDEFGLPTSFGRPNQRKHFAKNTRRSNKKPQILSHLADSEVEAVFNKHFSFFKDKQYNKNICKLPDPSSLFQEDKWNIDQFKVLKTELNHTKSKLNDLNLKEWHFHTTNTNLAGDVMKKVRASLGPEFLTQAWCKMYECLWSFWMVPEQFRGGRFNSVHLCEAPGAFITALNHFLQTWYPDTQWDWLATTLNPFHESNPLSHMIQDDRFILHTLDHWTFGRDGTGDLTDVENLRHLQERVDQRLGGEVMLVTADGSIDCQTNPAEQESIVAPLHYCETLAALSILQPGGSLMLKMFTMLECESVCLLFLLVCTFKSVNVFKPVKSKEGNSEVYVVCTEYIGQEELAPWLPTLIQHYGSSLPKAMFAEEDIPEEFKAEVYECAKMFTDMQIEVIERNLDLFHSPTPPKLLYSRLIKQKVADAYMEHYEMQPIEKFLVGNHKLSGTPCFNLAQRQEEGTFNDRVRRAAPEQSRCAEVHRMWQRAVEVSAACVWPHTANVCWFVFNTKPQPEVQVTVAQPVSKVYSSKFCSGRLLEVYTQLDYPQLHTSMSTDVPTCQTVDVSGLPWLTESARCNLQLLELISAALQTLPASKSLCLRGLPLLSQFTVAVVFLLAHSFYQVGLTVEGDVLLCGYRQALGNTEWLGSVLSEMRRLSEDRAVLSLLPINLLCDPSYSMKEGVTFYLCISRINNARLFQSIQTEVYRLLQGDPAILQSDPAVLHSDPAIIQVDSKLPKNDNAKAQSDPLILQRVLQSDPAIMQVDSALPIKDHAKVQSDPLILQRDAILQSDPAIMQVDSALPMKDHAKVQSDPLILQRDAILQSDPAIMQVDSALPMKDHAKVQSDPLILQRDAILQSDPAIMQVDSALPMKDHAKVQSDPLILQRDAILQSDPAIMQVDSALPMKDHAKVQSDPLILQRDAILQSDPAIMQVDSALPMKDHVKVQSDPLILQRVLQSDPAIMQVESILPVNDHAILQSGPAIQNLPSDPAILNSISAVLPSEPSVFQSDPAILQSELARHTETELLPSDPAILQSRFAISQTDPAILQSGPSILQSDPAVLQSGPAVLKGVPVMLPSDSTIQKRDPASTQGNPTFVLTDPAILQTDHAILQSGSAILQSDPVILKCDLVKPQSESVTLRSDSNITK